jgi:hypothetical protein
MFSPNGEPISFAPDPEWTAGPPMSANDDELLANDKEFLGNPEESKRVFTAVKKSIIKQFKESTEYNLPTRKT